MPPEVQPVLQQRVGSGYFKKVELTEATAGLGTQILAAVVVGATVFVG